MLERVRVDQPNSSHDQRIYVAATTEYQRKFGGLKIPGMHGRLAA
jgi:hypothetical protein